MQPETPGPPDTRLLERRLARANSARRQAEQLLEEKSLALYEEAQRREQAVVALQESEERYRLLVQLSPDAILVESDGEIVYANPAACSMFAGSPDEAAWPPGKDMVSLVTPAHRIRAMAAMASLGHGGGTGGGQGPASGSEQVVNSEEEVRQHDGQLLDVAVTRIAFGYRGKPAVQMVARDISHRKRLENQLIAQATHDALTGLPNRALLRERLAAEVAAARRHAHAVWVVFIDLDRFKFINDSLGHGVGDMVLKLVAERLRASTGPKDTVARLGGDEFAVLLPTADLAGTAATAADIVALVRDVVRLVDGGAQYSVTTSVGAVVVQDDSVTAAELLSTADMAMYDAKEEGRDRFVIHDTCAERSSPRMGQRIAWETRITDALDAGGFEVFAQPILDLESDRVVGAELLVRMSDASGVPILPGRFLRVAERTHLITAIDAYMLRAAAEVLGRLRDKAPDFSLSVNLSGRSVGDPGIAALLPALIERHGFAPANLVLEITETAAVQDIDTARVFAQQVRDLGCQLALDDFGAGFGSFYYLKHLVFDFVKIDGEFVASASHSASDRMIVASIVDIAHGLGKQAVAEFVADRELLDLMRTLGVDRAQGFHIGRPAPVDELMASLGRRSVVIAGRGRPVQ